MPIPDFNYNNVIPPHKGNPTDISHLSPYHCTILELCHKFATSADIIEILKGLVHFRLKLNANGILYGFQWLDGSFLENIEKIESRSPRDLDIVTFYGGLSEQEQVIIHQNFPEFIFSRKSKENFKLDHYPVDYTFNPEVTVERTRYWIQLFTHNRNGVWKGMLRLSLNTPIDDQHAIEYLEGIVL